MKFNIEIELDYIDEDGNLDEMIKESILSSVTSIVMKKVSEQVDAKLDEIIIRAATEKAATIVDQITEDFMTKEFSRIDKYGDTIEVGLTVKDLLKRDFDQFWSKQVDKNGSNNSYSGHKQSRLEWKLDEIIKEHSDDFSKTLVRDTENKIKAAMKESLSNSIGNKLVSELGFDKLLLESKN